MTGPIVFFSRCKPLGFDLVEIARRHKRVFIGWALLRKGASLDPRNMKSGIVDLRCSDSEWKDELAKVGGGRSYSANRNLVKAVSVGSIALIPRPASGFIYCGRVTHEFELVDSPNWIDEFLALKGGQQHQLSDVAQCWQVDDLVKVPVPRVPAWIRRSLFGRSTFGQIRAFDGIDESPHAAMSRVLNSDRFEPRTWSVDHDVIQRRLLNDLTPSTFEHLVVSLLQLEFPNELWMQTGGSGDGGLDGIAANQDGGTAALLQCKWYYGGGEVFLDDGVWQGGNNIRRYLAALQCPVGVTPPSSAIFLDRARIANLILKHHAQLPQAMALRAGAPATIAGEAAVASSNDFLESEQDWSESLKMHTIETLTSGVDDVPMKHFTKGFGRARRKNDGWRIRSLSAQSELDFASAEEVIASGWAVD